MRTPVLLLLYNRPKFTYKLLNRIKVIKPKYLYISVDGPKSKKDKKKINEIKKLIRNIINWDCKLMTRYNKKNLGCKVAVSKAITWFFKEVKFGIILEDDVIPSEFFFKYCSKLLVKYKNIKKISMITGFNPLQMNDKKKINYFCSNNFPIWGWATWRDRWKNYEADLEINKIFKMFLVQRQKIGFKEAFFNLNKFISNKLYWKDTWDIQWVFTCMKLKSYCLTPQINLIFNQDDKFYKWVKLNNSKYYSLIHPKKLTINTLYDKQMFNIYNNPYILKITVKNILTFIKEKILHIKD